MNSTNPNLSTLAAQLVLRAQIDKEQQTMLRTLLEMTLERGASMVDTLERCLEHLLTVSWLALLPKGGVFLKDQHDQQLKLMVKHNLSPALHTLCESISLGHCLCGRAAQSGKIEFASHVDERHEIRFEGMKDHGHYALPLISDDDVVGVLILYLKAGSPLDKDQSDFLTSVAGILAAFISRKQVEIEIKLEQENLEEKIRQRTAQLRIQEKRTRSILRTMYDGLIQIDASGAICEINDSALSIFGYESAQQLMGKDIELLMPDKYRASHHEHLQKYDPQSHTSTVIRQRVELEGLRLDGTTFPLELAIKSLQDESGLSFIAAVRDLSQQKATELQREQAKLEAERLAQAKSNFLANMSHEIRTPLNAIIGMSELCLGTPLDKRQRNYLEKIKVASDSLLHVINDILDFSKIDAGKLQLENNPFVLDSVLEQLSSVVAHHAEKQGVELTFEIDDASLDKVFLGDPMRLGQILTNLTTNAIKFSNGGNVIVCAETVSAALLENSSQPIASLHLSVSDEGIGMTPEQIDCLFQPFSQADASTTRRYGGTGLGLAICAHLVDCMGGEIWVDSQLGEGSTFHIKIPLGIYGLDRRKGVADFANRLANHAKSPVLIVDDNPIALKNLTRVVEQLGLVVHQAASTEAAVQITQASDVPPEYLLCLVDWKMPEQDGISCMRQLRSIYQNHGVKAPPMLLVTTYSHNDELNKITSEIDGLLGKPVSSRHLYVEMAHCLGLAEADVPKEDRRQGKGLQWGSLSQLDILVAEDIEVNQEVIKELLNSVGISIRMASNGVEVLAEVERKIPDVVLMDCHMPVLDGYEATRRLRANPATQHLPVIALTANATTADQEKCFAVGMVGHVAKPIRLEMLYAQIVRCVPSVARFAEVAPLTASTSLDMLSFPGIDLAVGLANVGGRQLFFLRMLKKFRDSQGVHFVAEFEAAIASNHWELQQRLAHSLKGVAATLGATALSQAAETLVCAVKAQNIPWRDQTLQNLRLDMAVAVNGLVQIDLEIEHLSHSTQTR